MKMGEVHTIERFYNARVDAYLVLAKLKNARSSPRPFVVGWQSRNPDIAATLSEPRHYMDRFSAARAFRERYMNGPLPEDRSLYRDWQKQTVYDWEDKFCTPHARKINEKEAQALIRKVCRDYKIKQTKLTMLSPKANSAYALDDHRVHLGHWDTIGLLHELAHVINENDIDFEDAPPHTPEFVYTAIELYARYAGLRLDYLTKSAEALKLTGDNETNQSVVAMRTIDPDRQPRSSRKAPSIK